MGDNNILATPDTIRSRDSATFTGAYQTLGSALTRNIRIVKIVNASNQNITISWDGFSNDNDFIPANGFTLYDISSDQSFSTGFFVQSGTQFLVKGAAGVGLVYLICIG